MATDDKAMSGPDPNAPIETNPFRDRIRFITLWPPGPKPMHRETLAIVPGTDAPSLAELLKLGDDDLWRDEHGVASVVLGRAVPRCESAGYRWRDTQAAATVYTATSALFWTNLLRKPQRERERAEAAAAARHAAEAQEQARIETERREKERAEEEAAR
jgi:hypothetical protein